ncbi:MAG TPA: alpha/beta hydrolase [Cryomorphaceae bacterium]|nr:alpha/beta hydrolase [Cryomorphaceae bacterium]
MKKIFFITLCTIWTVSVAWGQQGFSDLEKIRDFDELEYPYPVSKQKIDSAITMAYMDVGSGAETIVFIHGLGSYAPAWKRTIEGLMGEYRCIAVDLPGYGKSSKGNYEGSMTFFSESVIMLLDSLGVDRAVFAGHSMGGQISIVTALKYPDRVSKLILVAPAGIETFSEGEKEWFRDAITAKGVMLTPLDAIESNIGQNFYKMPMEAFFMVRDRYAMTGAGEDFLWYCNIIPKSVRGMVNQPVIRDLPKLKQPTLIVMGAADQLIPNRYLHGGRPAKIAKMGGKLIPNSTVSIIPRAGHFVMFEKPREVNEDISVFLNKD